MDRPRNFKMDIISRGQDELSKALEIVFLGDISATVCLQGEVNGALTLALCTYPPLGPVDGGGMRYGEGERRFRNKDLLFPLNGKNVGQFVAQWMSFRESGDYGSNFPEGAGGVIHYHGWRVWVPEEHQWGRELICFVAPWLSLFDK